MNAKATKGEEKLFKNKLKRFADKETISRRIIQRSKVNLKKKNREYFVRPTQYVFDNGALHDTEQIYSSSQPPRPTDQIKWFDFSDCIFFCFV